MNALANASSPYLLQHANNPVDWVEWSEEAFERARLENKSVFLSIGYSTCHWCHVMEHESFDSECAGFGSAPKSPRPALLGTLLRYEETSQMAIDTLEAMAMGGIHDHLAGGFHRYSVDQYWHIPHYEKMLYDQSQLLSSYTEAFRQTQNPFFETTIRSIANYLLKDLRDPTGGFHAAEDADSLPTQSSKQTLQQCLLSRCPAQEKPASAIVCQNQTCHPAIHSSEELKSLLVS